MHVKETAEKIREGRMSSLVLCEESVQRILENDQAGRKLNAVAALCPDWKEQALTRDRERSNASSGQPLYGIPVLVKDNIEVKGLPNTAGSYVLRDLIAEEDSYLVQRLREAGAVILGKTCLSEFAHWMDENMPSGYSSQNGQVLHPYNPSYDPTGSSTGSAVAVAAGYCDLAVGTETDGSLMAPAIANAVVSIKPTVGLISRRGILPLSPVQDTAGPIASSVADCALLLRAMASLDEQDPASADAEIHDYTGALETDLSGRRIGVFTIRGVSPDEEAMKLLKRLITEHGGEVAEFEFSKAYVPEYNCFFNEFKYGINRYLRGKSCGVRSLKDIIEQNRAFPERCLKYGQDLLLESEETSGDRSDPAYLSLRKKTDDEAKQLLYDAIERHSLSCLVSAGSAVNTNLAAVSGACSMVLPARELCETVYNPLSFYLMGKPNTEAELIRLAYMLEQSLRLDCRPSWRK